MSFSPSAWDWWSGRGDKRGHNTRDNRRVRQQRATLRCDARGNFLVSVHAVQRRTPEAVRCTAHNRWCGCWSWRLVDQLGFVGIGTRWSAVSVIVCLFCHGPYRRTLLSQLWRDVLGEEFTGCMECRGLRHDLAEVVVAVGTQATPTSRPRLVFARRGGRLEIKPRRQQYPTARQLTPLAGGVVIGQEGGCTPLTNVRCRDCLVWDVDEACRIR